jgi:hypothetical protein
MPGTTTFEVHPAIGIARVGSSEEMLIGPEPGLPIDPVRRDSTASKLLKRQSARFRVYQCERDAAGQLLSFKQLAPDKVDITWSVHLVNRKAAAPSFLAGGGPNTTTGNRRNGATGDDAIDADLIIDAKVQALTGTSQPALELKGQFKGNEVILGHISTDADGRLIAAGGFGRSASIDGSAIGNFADNDRWFDDSSDGPVEATIHFKDGSTPDKAVDKPAWLVCCQPDFAPGIGNIVTLYDAFVDVAIARGVLSLPTFKPAFDLDVLPLLNRALAYQWVNQQNRVAHGPGGTADFSSMTDLGDPTASNARRKHIFGFLTDPDQPPAGPIPAFRHPMPALFSDFYFTDKTLTLVLTRSQYRIFRDWANGNFDATGAPRPAPALDDPDALTRFGLDQCVGASFCPGIEAGRKIRADIYAAGEVVRFDRSKLKPGGFTESMALPWQADFFDCTWENESNLGKGRGWWPAQRPDDVFLEVGDSTMSPWIRNVNSPDEMVAKWDQLGIVLDKGSSGSPFFVEDQRVLP